MSISVSIQTLIDFHFFFQYKSSVDKIVKYIEMG